MIYLLIMLCMVVNSIILIYMFHPLTMGFVLLNHTLLTCFCAGLWSKSFWFSYILFLIFIGGMLILFMYMSSVASNEKLIFSFKISSIMLLMLTVIILMMMFLWDKFYFSPISFNNEYLNSHIFFYENNFSISKMYSYPNNFVTLFLVSYLLLTLIIVVKMTNNFMGPLRSLIN